MNIVKERIQNKPISKDTFKVFTIGTSTGGPAALQQLILSLPDNIPAAIMIVQHIAKGFICELAEYLQNLSPLHITVANNGDKLTKGTIYFAPDDYNMEVDKSGYIKLTNEPGAASLFVPSIDIMMRSVADVFSDNAIGIILTGMGKDGVEGMKAIKKAGGITIAQDGHTSVIYGMNRLTVENVGVDYIVPIDKLSAKIVEICETCKPIIV
jgi:two-component system chemotaxis response regulator CheB